MSTKSAQEWLLSHRTDECSREFTQTHDQKKLKRRAITISVTSGKGGVGKTTVAITKAKTLASWGFKVLLIDCDTNLSNTFLKLGIPFNNDFEALVKGEKKFDEILHREGNLHLLAACNGSLELYNREWDIGRFIMDILVKQENNYDFILLDCPAGLGKETLLLNAYCDLRFVVVNPDRSSITDSYSLMKILSLEYGIRENHLVINKFKGQSQFNKIVKTLSETVENFLSGRLFIAGGIEREDLYGEDFDKRLGSLEKNSLHAHVAKLLGPVVEELTGIAMSEDEDHRFGTWTQSISAQDVRPTI